MKKFYNLRASSLFLCEMIAILENILRIIPLNKNRMQTPKYNMGATSFNQSISDVYITKLKVQLIGVSITTW